MLTKQDFDLIQQEFKQQNEPNMIKGVITKSLIDSLFKTYNRCTYSELYYDSEPNIPNAEWERLDSTKEGQIQYQKMVEEYDSDRKKFNNWVDPYDEGIWCMTNKYVRELAKNLLTELKKSTYKEDRFYIGKNKDGISLYYYARDTDEQLDYWFHFWNEENRNCPCDSCKRNFCKDECKKYKEMR